VVDGDKVAEIYEPHEEHDARAHLARLQRRRGVRPEVKATPERTLTLAAPTAATTRGSSSGARNREDPKHPFVKRFSNGWFVWNPLTETFVGQNAGPFLSELEALAKVLELSNRMKARPSKAEAPAPLLAAQAPAAAPGPAPSRPQGALFDHEAPKKQMGFKFNDRAAVARSRPGAARYHATRDGDHWRVVDADGAVIFSANLRTNPLAEHQARALAEEENGIVASKHRGLADTTSYYPNDRRRAVRRNVPIVGGASHASVCSCGEREHHPIAQRSTADGIRVVLWSDGSVTGGMGAGLHGVPIRRPKTAEAVQMARRTGELFIDAATLYNHDELGPLYAAAEKTARRGGAPGDLRAEASRAQKPRMTLKFTTTSTDNRGDWTEQVAQLDRMRWPGLAVFRTRSGYELVRVVEHQRGGSSTAYTTGLRFKNLDDLTEHLFNVQGTALRPSATRSR
jgi:hypothetical protein